MNPYDDLINVDPLKLYFGDPYVVNDYVTIYQPTIGDIIEYGEREYYSMIQTVTAIPSEMKSSLWDSGLDWNQVEDFQLFMMLSQSLSQKQTEIILGDIDLQRMQPRENLQNGHDAIAKLGGVTNVDLRHLHDCERESRVFVIIAFWKFDGIWKVVAPGLLDDLNGVFCHK